GGFDPFAIYTQIALRFIQKNFGTPSQYISAVAIAPYVDLPSSINVNVPGLTLDQIFAGLNQGLSKTASWIQSNAAVASSYNFPLVGYEGGQEMYPGKNGANYTVMLQAQSDPRM